MLRGRTIGVRLYPYIYSLPTGQKVNMQQPKKTAVYGVQAPEILQQADELCLIIINVSSLQ